MPEGLIISNEYLIALETGVPHLLVEENILVYSGGLDGDVSHSTASRTVQLKPEVLAAEQGQFGDWVKNPIL